MVLQNNEIGAISLTRMMRELQLLEGIKIVENENENLFRYRKI